MTAFKCKMCGASLSVAPDALTVTCDYCHTAQTLPRIDDDRRANLYDRGNHFRRANDYDKAMRIFEQVLADDPSDAEAYWSIVLCRYGIEYVEDPLTGKRIPTINRMQPGSILADEDYKATLAHADLGQKRLYEEEARAISAIQEGISEVAAKEDPFDVFICYKETDSRGERTKDSVLANDLYHQLTQEGFRVFFSRITLEDKLGSAYEPYIYAALQSAKVMVVLGTSVKNFNAVWVKNEWARYLSLIKNGARKTIIPAYRDMDPYDLPEEFSHLQAQDMSKLGFMQDLIRGIKKIVGSSEPNTSTVPVGDRQQTVSPQLDALLQRAQMALEDGEWERVDEFCEMALNNDARNALAYLYKLMAQLKVSQRASLADQPVPFDSMPDCKKAMRFDESISAELEKANVAIRSRLEREISEAEQALYAERMGAKEALEKRVEAANARLAEIDAEIEELTSASSQPASFPRIAEAKSELAAFMATPMQEPASKAALASAEAELAQLGFFDRARKKELEKTVALLKQRFAEEQSRIGSDYECKKQALTAAVQEATEQYERELADATHDIESRLAALKEERSRQAKIANQSYLPMIVEEQSPREAARFPSKREGKDYIQVVKRIARLYEQKLAKYEVYWNVDVRKIDPYASSTLKPIDFLVFRDGNPVLAVVVTTEDGYADSYFRGARDAIKSARVKCLEFFVCDEQNNTVSKIYRKTLDALKDSAGQ